jgi:hypothetical protein
MCSGLGSSRRLVRAGAGSPAAKRSIAASTSSGARLGNGPEIGPEHPDVVPFLAVGDEDPSASSIATRLLRVSTAIVA